MPPTKSVNTPTTQGPLLGDANAPLSTRIIHLLEHHYVHMVVIALLVLDVLLVVASIVIPPEMLESDEDEEGNEDLNIDPSTEKNGGVSTHIMYVRALCHREIKQYKIALDSYAKVMKRENELNQYE